MSIYLKAALASIVAHSFVALAFKFGRTPSIDLPELDPSAVEISFSVVERETPLVSDTPPLVSDTPPPPLVSDTPPLVSDTPPLVSDTLPPLVSDTPLPLVLDTPPSLLVSDTPPPLVSDTPLPKETNKRINEQTVKRLNGPTVQRSNDLVSAPAPKQARVDAPPKLLKSIKPDYPTRARKRGEEGDVSLELVVNERGLVESVSIIESCGHPDLDAAAVRAAKKARFTPAKSGGKAVPSTASLAITFKLTSR